MEDEEEDDRTEDEDGGGELFEFELVQLRISQICQYTGSSRASVAFSNSHRVKISRFIAQSEKLDFFEDVF